MEEGDDKPMIDLAANKMVTAVCWVSRGFAKPVLDAFEHTVESEMEVDKMKKKIAK